MRPGVYLRRKSIESSDNFKKFLVNRKEERKVYATAINLPGHTVAITFSNQRWYFINHDKVFSTDDDTISKEFLNKDFYDIGHQGKIVAEVKEYQKLIMILQKTTRALQNPTNKKSYEEYVCLTKVITQDQCHIKSV